MPRPEYCEAGEEGTESHHDPCPACGATIAGDDPVRGVCQAKHNRPRPEPYLELALIDKRTGEIVAKTVAYH